MVEIKEAKNPLGVAYESARAASGEPEELRRLRDESWARFEEAGVPTVKHEEWKYTSLKALANGEFVPASAVAPGDVEWEPGPLGGYRLVFVNGRFDASRSDASNLPSGVIIEPLASAILSHQEAVLSRLGKIASLEGKLGSFNDTRFVWLNNASFADGAYVRIAKGVEVGKPIHIVFLNLAERAAAEVFPRVLIELEEGAIATVCESHYGLGGSYFSGPVTEIAVARHATLDHVRVQAEGDGATHIGALAATQDAESTWRSTTAAFGSAVSRLDTFVWVGGEHAETSLNGVYVGDGHQVLDNHTRIDHAVPNCHSFEVYKGILAGKSQGVFNGKIFVYKDAQKTDAKQTNQALLLTKTAGVNTKPQLEIFADDVKCTHGATVGQLREDALFYLRARGIPLNEAKSILVYAFAAEVFEGIGNETIRTDLERRLYEKLAAAHVEPIS